MSPRRTVGVLLGRGAVRFPAHTLADREESDLSATLSTVFKPAVTLHGHALTQLRWGCRVFNYQPRESLSFHACLMITIECFPRGCFFFP